jgi:cytochrome bd ubiquinol oxidase subunit I
MLWILMLAVPFPYIATTAGWWTAELGRQPWIVRGLMRTANGGSALINPGDVVFTTLGFAGLYFLPRVLVIFQVLKTRVRPSQSAVDVELTIETV